MSSAKNVHFSNDSTFLQVANGVLAIEVNAVIRSKKIMIEVAVLCSLNHGSYFKSILV